MCEHVCAWFMLFSSIQSKLGLDLVCRLLDESFGMLDSSFWENCSSMDDDEHCSSKP